ncbi:phospholipase C [Clostridium felsineum]|uniref:Phospholipase C n=1 Tax=Clostridium felsineum TaxID=36839 RepID=A0A1S8LRB8_9CLOT|nr:phospholipase C [Clostridium felsineum]MCR3760111.1 zinc dependent phospholipase C family protein [Clostridium felsineum]URZ01347.1 hypothetical protein CLAUR_013370 [Clostridium felsineum]URZ05817.1 hypothetical protein CLROS_011480 [Clostridium felsineum]URZ10856.1 hypothetical protein CROST_015710 [Clostridium felsineum]
MKKKFESTYGRTIRGIFFVINPVKKKVIKTTCIIHKYINSLAIEILKGRGNENEYKFFSNNIEFINEGTVWADQDFKSTNHFFDFEKGRGLYGFSNLIDEGQKYYNMSINYLKAGDKKKSLFYFGAACHIIQDSTVPQHVNNRLLNSHRNFEMWIIQKFLTGYRFMKADEILRSESIRDYVKKNAIVANKIYNRCFTIKDKENRYNSISNYIICQAQMSTSGLMMDYYDKYKAICEKDSSSKMVM